jgi:hypothetical protein
MTPEERQRMDVLCHAIQEEKDYDTYAGLLRELSDLIQRKEERRFKNRPSLVWTRTRPWKTVAAVVHKVVKPAIPNLPEKVEISISAADHLFREVRFENSLNDLDGTPVALRQGAHVDITFEADAKDTIRRAAQSV